MSADEPTDEPTDEPSGEEQVADEEDTGVPTSKQRRATAKRKLERQLERRAQQARRRRIVTIAALAAVVVVVAGLAVWQFVIKKDSDETTAASNTTTTSVAPTQDTAVAGVLPPFRPPQDLGANCQYPATPAQPAAKPVQPPRTGKIPTEPKMVSVSMMTNVGPIGIQLDNEKAPCTVNNFASLAGQNYFDNTRCHRETNGPELFVLQCGDPKAEGTGGPGYQFANEYPTNQYLPDDPSLNEPVVYPRGTLAMANAGPGTNGSQFFMVYQDSKLPPNYTVFGKIDQTGLATLDKIAAAGIVPSGNTTKPAQDVTINSVRLD